MVRPIRHVAAADGFADARVVGMFLRWHRGRLRGKLTGRMSSVLHRSGFSALAMLAAMTSWAPIPVRAEIEIKTLADGTTVVSNPRKASRRLVPGRARVRTPRPELLKIIERHARRVGLEARLVQAVVQAESGYNVQARSSKGAMGLMQLMPATARELRVRDPYDPEQNVRGGTTYLRRMLDHFDGSLVLALAAYNAGPGAVERHGGVPPYRETQNYVRKVYGLYRGDLPSMALASTRTPRRPAASSGAAPTSANSPARGKKVYVTRDANNRIVFTTKAPGPH